MLELACRTVLTGGKVSPGIPGAAEEEEEEEEEVEEEKKTCAQGHSHR